MATIRREIEVEAPPDEVAAMWSRFIEWVRLGSGRLTCDELACVDAVRAGLVQFGPAEANGRHTIVSFTLPLEGEGPSEDLLERRMGRDLMVFKDYVERTPVQVRRATVKNRRVPAKGDRALVTHRPRSDGRESGDKMAYTKNFPT